MSQKLLVGLRVCCCVLLGSGVISSSYVSAGTLTVTTTVDSSRGSLRQAISDANAAPGPDTIVFDIPESECGDNGVCEIVLTSALPDITTSMVIDGTTQPQFGSAPEQTCATDSSATYLRIQVTGEAETIFRITSAERSTIRGLSMGGPNTIVVVDSGGLAAIQCNLFGLAGDGETSLGNFSEGIGFGYSGAAQPSIVGTDGDGIDDVGEGNVFGDGSRCINVNTGSGNRISGNWFGVASNGIDFHPVATAVFMRQRASDNLVGSDRDGVSDELERNVIAYAQYGVHIRSEWGFDGDRVVGNWIGVDAEGNAARVTFGVELGSEGKDHLVAHNRIETLSQGIRVTESSSLAVGSTDNCILSLGIGLRHDGSATDLDATQNWWGDPSGPSGIGQGFGTPIEVTGSGSVIFDPWLSDPGETCSVAADPVYRFVAPGTASIGGVGDSFFTTDVEINNGGDEVVSFELLWLPRDTDNENPLRSATFTLDPGKSRRFVDVLSTVFGLSSAVGAVMIEADGPNLRVMSRTFNTAEAGTFGQSLPGVSSARMFAKGRTVRILFMTENDAYRSNLGMVNGTDRDIVVSYRLFTADGVQLVHSNKTLPPWGNTQINQIFAPYGQVDSGYVDLWVSGNGDTFTCYGSVLDNMTSDPTTVLAD